MPGCKVCGAPRAPLNEQGSCKNGAGCERRRVERRIHEDKKRGARQCMSAYGTTSVRFCLMGQDHEGLHANGGIEWSDDDTTAAGRSMAASFKASMAAAKAVRGA